MTAVAKRDRSAYELMQAVSKFWSRVERDRSERGCWLYTGGTNSRGYGLFHFGGRKVYAHRFSFVLKHGRRIPDGIYVCHRCDVRNCVNPDHLFLGTSQVNALDRVYKRALRTMQTVPLSQRPRTREERERRAFLVRSLAALDYPQRQIAREFDIDDKTVRRILARKLPPAA